MEERKNIFLQETIDPECFVLENVLHDNACFYRAIGNCIMNRDNYIVDKLVDIKQQTDLARELQSISYEWLVQNKNAYINWNLENDSSFKINVSELIKIVHDISYEEYVLLYKHFAGDLVLGEHDDNIFCLQNRWGSYVEQIAISNRLQLPIFVFILQKYDEKKNKIIGGRIFCGKKIYKNTRLKICQISGIEYINKQKPIFLLWKKSKTGDQDHYMSLYPASKNIERELIKNLI